MLNTIRSRRIPALFTTASRRPHVWRASRTSDAAPSGSPMSSKCASASPPAARISSTTFEGVTSRGVDVVDLGLTSTDLVYFASGFLDVAAVSVTASHNPPNYNGLKFCLAGAVPVGEDTGLGDIRALAERDERPPTTSRGTVERRDLLEAYVEHVLGFVDADAIAPLTVVADTANGMGGLVVPPVMEHLPVKLVALYPELDGTFPNHPADPIVPENQADLRRAVVEHRADVGMAFDGDADRVFLVDEHD